MMTTTKTAMTRYDDTTTAYTNTTTTKTTTTTTTTTKTMTKIQEQYDHNIMKIRR